LIVREFSRVNTAVTRNYPVSSPVRTKESIMSGVSPTEEYARRWKCAVQFGSAWIKYTETLYVDNVERLKRLILHACRNSLESPSESRCGSERRARVTHVCGISFVIYRRTIFMKPEGDFMRNAIAESAERWNKTTTTTMVATNVFVRGCDRKERYV